MIGSPWRFGLSSSDLATFSEQLLFSAKCKYRLLFSSRKYSKPGHSKDSLWNVDLFRCESILLKSYWVLVVMDQFTRRNVGFGVNAGDVDGIALCCMFNSAISNKATPQRLSSERLIGTIRREYLDRLFFWNDQDLEQKLVVYRHYYNNHRARQSLDGNTPLPAISDNQVRYAKLDYYAWQSHCKGMFQTPIAA